MVVLVQALLLQRALAKAEDTVKSTSPKLRPVMLIAGLPLVGMLLTENDTTGPSNVSVAKVVPTTEPTVTCRYCSLFRTRLWTHATVVDEDHEEVLQATRDTSVVAVKSKSAKLNPLTVTEPDPLSAAFCVLAETTAASKLYARNAVPTTDPTVTYAVESATSSCAPPHETEVLLVHPLVKQSAEDSRALLVSLCTPKFSPVTAINDCPLGTPFRLTYEPTGESNVISIPPAVPASAATVTCTLRPTPILLPSPHTMVVLVDQSSVEQAVTSTCEVAVRS